MIETLLCKESMMSKSINTRRKSFTERGIHALLYEVIALLCCAPLAAWFMSRPLWQMGTLTWLLSCLAIVWNIFYNTIFDALWPESRLGRSYWVRVCHGVAFEGGFIVLGLPLAAYWLQVSLLTALQLEVGLLLFFLPYTIVYNAVYDRLQQNLFTKKQESAS